MGSALLSFPPRDPGWPGMPSAVPGSSPALVPLLLRRPGHVQPQTSVSLSGCCAHAGRQLSIVTAASLLSRGWGPQHLQQLLLSPSQCGEGGSLRWHRSARPARCCGLPKQQHAECCHALQLPRAGTRKPSVLPRRAHPQHLAGGKWSGSVLLPAPSHEPGNGCFGGQP